MTPDPDHRACGITTHTVGSESTGAMSSNVDPITGHARGMWHEQQRDDQGQGEWQAAYRQRLRPIQSITCRKQMRHAV
jgi:hypothetical protein